MGLPRLLLSSRLSSTNLAEMLKAEEFLAAQGTFLEESFDDFYTRQLLEQVPKYVDRTSKLRSLIVQDPLPNEVRLYATESATCYIFGHWLACIGLARAALDAALRDRLSARGETQFPFKLDRIVKLARKVGVLDGPLEEMAQRVRRAGNEVLHQRAKAGPRLAFNRLADLRGVLLHLYRPVES